jgi:hypothetical protein
MADILLDHQLHKGGFALRAVAFRRAVRYCDRVKRLAVVLIFLLAFSFSNTGVQPAYAQTDNGSESNSYCDQVSKETDPARKAEAQSMCDRETKLKACDAKRKEGYVMAWAFNSECVNLPEFMNTLVNYLMLFASLIAGIMFVYGSFKYISSRGNPSDLGDGRDILTSSVIGILLIACAYIIIQFLGSAFGSVDSAINLTPFF